jgi:hypothetical protein
MRAEMIQIKIHQLPILINVRHRLIDSNFSKNHPLSICADQLLVDLSP